MNTHIIPVVSIVGKSGVGKTTLLEKIIPELKHRGYRVAIIKHHAHPGFKIDQPGKDTWRYAQAGCDHIVLAAPDKIAIIHSLDSELTLDEITSSITEVDIILTEGYKRAGKPAIEVVRKQVGKDLLCSSDQLSAVVSDHEVNVQVPVFALDDIAPLVDWIVRMYLTH